MDEPCFSASSFLDRSCGLIDDIEEPSLSSLDESVTSFKDGTLIREDSFSDGEAMRNIMTSTPQKKNEQRRSVSLVDVSKIEGFTSRPLGNMLASWETIGSQSSVGKSRDSGYIHSGSLLSINSAKLSELKDCTDQMGVVLEECNRLKRELEYSEVLINTLQESNNDLRMKCAAAHNRISELRLKCVNHCDCCSQQYGRSKPLKNLNSDSIFVESSESSSSSDTSRSPSPQPPRSQSCRLFTPKSRMSHNKLHNKKRDAFSRRDEDSFSDLSDDTPCRAWPVVRNLTEPISSNVVNKRKSFSNERDVHSRGKQRENFGAPIEKQTRNFDLTRSQTTECSSSTRYVSESETSPEREEVILVEGQVVDHPREVSSTGLEDSSPEESNKTEINIPSSSDVKDVPSINEGMKKNLFHSVEDLFASFVKEKQLEDNKPVFVANEVNGKICVGNFRVWQKPKVSPRSSLMTAPVVTAQNPSPPSDKLKQDSDASDKSQAGHPLQTNFQVRVSISPSPGYSSRPISVCSTFSKSSNVSYRRQMSLSNQSLNNHENYAKAETQNPYPYVTSRKDVKNSKVNSSQFSSQMTPMRSSSGVLPTTVHGANKPCNPPNDVSVSSNSPANSNSKRNSCQENLSNLGVTVTKKEKKSLCPESWMNKLKSFKLDKIPLGFLIQSDSPEKVENGVKASKAALNPDSNYSSEGVELNQQVVEPDSQPHSVHHRQENMAQHYSENIQDCLDNADQLSRKVAHLLHQLKYIQNIGKA